MREWERDLQVFSFLFCSSFLLFLFFYVFSLLAVWLFGRVVNKGEKKMREIGRALSQFSLTFSFFFLFVLSSGSAIEMCLGKLCCSPFKKKNKDSPLIIFSAVSIYRRGDACGSSFQWTGRGLLAFVGMCGGWLSRALGWAGS